MRRRECSLTLLLAAFACSGRTAPTTAISRDDATIAIMHEQDGSALHYPQDEAKILTTDPRLAEVREYEDTYCTYAHDFVDRVKALRDSSTGDARQSAQALLQSYEKWNGEHAAPVGMLPPARPGDFLDPSGLQPTAQMYYCGFDMARMLMRLEACAAGEPTSVLRGVKGEPATPSDHSTVLWGQYLERNPQWRKR